MMQDEYDDNTDGFADACDDANAYADAQIAAEARAQLKMPLVTTPTVYKRVPCDRTLSQKSSYVHETGAKDSKGRPVGATIFTAIAEFSPRSKKTGIYHMSEPGAYLLLNIHATRDGRNHGPCQADKYYDTAEDM